MADIGHARKTFPLADILSVTTGVLLSRRRMNGVCDLVAFVTATPTAPRFMGRDDIRALLANSAAARAELLSQHSFLAELTPGADLDDADLYSWLVTAEKAHGTELSVRCPHNHLTPRQIAAFDQLEASCKDGFAKMRDSFTQFTDVLSDAAERMKELAATIQDQAEQPSDERTTP